jgi:hypothetical protein
METRIDTRLSAPRIFILGPALFAPVMMIVSAAYSPWQHYGSWMIWLIVLGLPILVLWHSALIVAKPEPWTRGGCIAYAILNLVFYAYIAGFCLGTVTGDWL